MKIVAIGPNPAYQKSIELAEFVPFEVNRASSVRVCAGGKGIHFARAINRLQPGTAAVAHLLGGDTGRDIHEWCREDAAQIVTWTGAATRTCSTVLCRKSQRMTELIEPTGEPTADEAAAFRAQVLAACADVDGIGLCGTLPGALGGDFYAAAARAKGKALVLLDGYRDVEIVLNTGCVDILKINRHELAMLSGVADPLEGAERCLQRWGIRWLGMTDGAQAATLFGREEAWQFSLPRLAHVANPIGAGDTVSAVFLLRLLQGEAPEVAFAGGLAAATASCQSLIGADFTAEAASAILQQIQLTQIRSARR